MWLYRLILRFLFPALLGVALWQRLTGRTGAGALAERMGLGGQPVDLWLHGASNGELASARWLVERVIAARPGLRMVVTCNTGTARAMVAGWNLPGVAARLAPFDTPGAVGRFIAGWQPRTLILLENELWPERIARMAGRGPVILLGARMSERSALRWGRRAPGILRAVLGGVTLASAQDAASEARLVTLGLPASSLGPRLMLKARAAAAPPVALPFSPPHPRARILLAASTHEGEEAVVLAAFAASRATFDLLILAPRHPRRSAAIATLIAAGGLPYATRSAGETPGPEVAVYLADTLGEMPNWYAMAGATVIGGSFAARGGHTPFEPAAHGSAILHGPSVHNFTEVFALLDSGGGAIATDEASLASALTGCNAAAQARLAARAADLLTGEDAAAALLGAVLNHLPDARSVSG